MMLISFPGIGVVSLSADDTMLSHETRRGSPDLLVQDYTEDKLHEEVLEADAFLQPLTQLKIKTCNDPGGPRDKLTPLSGG